MNKVIKYLRISYLSAAIADFLISVLVLFPERMGLTQIEYPMGLLSAITFSWGVLLLFAYKEPLERRWILLPTILVISLLTITRIVFSIYGIISFSIGLALFGVCLILLLTYSYIISNRVFRDKVN